MIRNYVYRKVSETLNEGYFSNHDFSISSESSNYNDSLVIQYNYAEYSLSVTLPNSTSSDEKYRKEFYSITGTMKPGFIATSESVNYKNIEGLLKGITDWLNLIKQDIQSIPYERKIQEQNIEIEKIKEDINEIKNENFTKEEIDKLNKSLDELEKKLSDAIKKSETDKKKNNSELDILHKEIEALKNMLEVVEKPKWYNMMVIRLNGWMNDPVKVNLINNGAKIVKSLMDQSLVE